MIRLRLHEHIQGSEDKDAHAPAPKPVPLAQVQAALGASFRVQPAFAEGGMATLFPLEHALHGAQMVAKVLHLELSQRAEIRSAFFREARHAALLGDHPHAIPVFDVLERNELVMLLMPFIDGEDLDRLLERRGPLGRDEALAMAAQVSSLLCYAESLGITHGDIAPGNLRLDSFQQYRLMDFGLSHRLSESEGYVALGGTPLYNSPEILQGEIPDTRSDLYSLGVVLVEAITGMQIFRAGSLGEIRRKHLTGDWRMPGSLEADEPLCKLLHSLLCAQREQRMRSAFELSGALAAMGFEAPQFRGRVGSREAQTGKRRTRIS